MGGLKAGVSTFFGLIFHGIKGLVTGETGRAIGERAVEIYQNDTGEKFVGEPRQWRGVIWWMISEIAGTNAIAEGAVGVDLAENRTLEATERWQRFTGGIGAFFGWALVNDLGPCVEP